MFDLLEKIGWSKQFFADHIEVDRTTLYNWEKNGAPKVVIRYLELIDRHMNKLLGEENGSSSD